MRFGLIGYGAWGRQHAAAIEKVPDASVAAIACRTEASAAEAHRDFPDTAVYLDYRRLLDRADIDAVDVVVPNHLHAEIGVASLERGKDVLLEKPMALTLAECDRLIVAAGESGRVLTIGHELRLSSQWGRVKALLDAGEIGEPTYAHVSRFRFPYRPGSAGWRHEAERVGSWVLEELVHHFDLLLWYFERWGGPVSVFSHGNARDGNDPKMSGNFSSVLRFREPLYAVVTKTVAGFEYHLALEIAGTEGAIRTWWSGSMDRTRHPTFELKVKRRGQREPETVAIESSGELFELEKELRQTVIAFAERRPLVSGAEARTRVLVCLEAERSLREGREIALY
ncbi:MAG: gfo/Idh/MocA family oxidoreductase [Candidatus Rokuibacteriota bacterium]|nr:MAG: gfo/Idh/MocA family oxidoreductase [Candidatus Rokubacteria bacterium]